MIDPWILAALLALSLASFAWLLRWVLRFHRLRERVAFEDALKYLLTAQHRGRLADIDSLAGSLRTSQRRALRLISRLEAAGLLRSFEGGFRLTAEGERAGLHVLRAHRLWERYLADEVGIPIARLHRAAERAEHHLTPEDLNALDARLGHPLHDPHGDPIPTATGIVPHSSGKPLTDWEADTPAHIVHIEDEPQIIFDQILAEGLRPGMTIRVLHQDSERLILTDGEDEFRLAPVVAANVQVDVVPVASEATASALRLSELPDGVVAEVVAVDSEVRGFNRRRLLDLGLTPGTSIHAELRTAFGDPRAFRVRGTLIALREDQAANVWVRPLDG